MANVKLSQITAAAGPPTATDSLVGVLGGTNDRLVSLSQVVGGSANSVQFNSAGSFGGFGVWTASINTLQLGAADSAAPPSQTLGVPNGTGANISGADWNLLTSKPTGTGLPGNLNVNSTYALSDVGAQGVSMFIGFAQMSLTSGSGSFQVLPATPVVFTTTGVLPTGITAGVTYYVTADTGPNGFNLINAPSGQGQHFSVSATPGGTAIVVTGSQSGVHTVTPSVTTAVGAPLTAFTLGPAGITNTFATYGPLLTLTRWDAADQPPGGTPFDSGILLNYNLLNPINTAGITQTFFNVKLNGVSLFSVGRPGTDADIILGTQSAAGDVNGNAGLVRLKCFSSTMDFGICPALHSYQPTPSTQIFMATNGSGGLGQFGYIGFTPTTQTPASTHTSPDAAWWREAAGIIAQRDGFTGTNAQSYKVYNTADTITVGIPTNYEVAVFDWKITTNTLKIGTQAAGTGTVRDFAMVKGANTFFTSATTVVGSLPAAGVKGRRHFVTDANAVTFQSIVAGGGANNVPVFDDGTNWRIG